MSEVRENYQFQGTDGRLEYADSRTVECDYEVKQEETGALWIRCEHDQGGWVWAEGPELPPPCRFTATTDGGERLLLEGEFLQVSDLPDSPSPQRSVQVRYVVNGPGLRVVASAPAAAPLTVRYDIVNLSFTGKLFTEYPLPDGGYRRSFDTLSLNLGGRSVSVVLVRDARSVLNRIRATKGIGVTARVQTTIHELSDLEAVDLDIGRLCSLLTLATGSKIVWTARETRAASERLDLTVRSAVTRSISEAPLIDTDDPDTLRHFLEATLRPYVEFEVTYELARVIDARVDGISGGFLETRTLMLGVLADYLTGRFSHVHQVGFGSFEEHLRNMVKHVCPDVRGKDIRKFVNTRDMLAHEMRFRTADKVAEFRHALHVVNRLLLGVLAYHGPYVDCRTWTVVTPPSDTPTQQAKNS